jgi:hypothetical protein
MKSFHHSHGLVAALLMALLSCWPQLDLWWTRGSHYQGACAYAQFDEDMYAAYLNGIIMGRPRRSDPSIELQANRRLEESFFSVQFAQPLLLAQVARATGLNTKMIFILLSPMVAFLSTLALFYLLILLTNDTRLAFCGSLFILCFGTLAGRNGFVMLLSGLRMEDSGLPFLRRYQPGLSFPLFFFFMLLTWLAVNQRNRWGWLYSISAGLGFAALVFSYFYVWTAAAAWLFVFVMLWLSAYYPEWKILLLRLSPIFIIVAVTLSVYALLLSRIAPTTASTQALELIHAPDWQRGPEVIGAVVLILLFLAVKKRFAQLKSPLFLLILSLILHLFLLFNQQILTGRSLQPFHYEVFIGNYTALLALVLVLAVFKQRSGMGRSILSKRVCFWLCIAALFWGAIETMFNISRHRDLNLARDAFMPVTRRLTELAVAAGDNVNKRKVLFSPDVFAVAGSTPGYTPQAVLWVSYALFMPTLNEQQRLERFFQYSYYSGLSPEEMKKRLNEGRFAEVTGLFGYERYLPNHSVHFKPVTAAEIQEKVSQYTDFITTFNYQRASIPALSWVVIPANLDMDFSNLDRWYIREVEEIIGEYRLFHVRLRDLSAQQGSF